MAKPQTLSAEAFATQFRRCARALWGVAVSVLGDPTRAEDVVQDAAMIGLQKRDGFVVGTSFTAWMATIVRLTALNHQRRWAKAMQGVDDPPAREMPLRYPTLRISRQGLVEPNGELFDDAVLQALGELGDDARACLLLRILAEPDYGEIAEFLEISEGTVRSHVHRARV